MKLYSLVNNSRRYGEIFCLHIHGEGRYNSYFIELTRNYMRQSVLQKEVSIYVTTFTKANTCTWRDADLIFH